MSDITASERRLSAALDRMDQLLDAGLRPADSDRDRNSDRDLIDTLTRERDAALAQMPGQGGADDAAQAELRARLDAATDQAAALSGANEALIAANRDLLEAQQTGGIGPDEARTALEAELSALRAARAAEMAQMSEIMAELERLLADEPPVIDGPPLEDVAEADPSGDDLSAQAPAAPSDPAPSDPAQPTPQPEDR